MDKTGLLINLVNIQVEVLRRVMERKQEDLMNLASEKSVHLTNANNQLQSKLLPSLPVEIITQIFCSLYFIESSEKRPRNSTLWALMDDSRTPTDWQRFIQDCIPTMATETRLSADWSELHPDSRLTIQSLLGAQPNNISPGVINSIASSSLPATVLMIANDWPILTERWDDLCQIPWHCLVLADSFDGSRTEGFELAMLNEVVEKFRRKLSEIDSLVVSTNELEGPVSKYKKEQDEEYDHPYIEDQLVARNRKVHVPKLRTASLPLRLLRNPGLRPYLNLLTELEVDIPSDVQAQKMKFDRICVDLQPFSATLVKLRLSDVRRSFRWRFSHNFGNPYELPSIDGSFCQTLFPKLRSLSLKNFVGCIAWDAIRCLDCPLLTELSINLDTFDDISEDFPSAASLHGRFPSVQTIILPVKDYPVGLLVSVSFYFD